jgi:hypothetical protein
MRLVTRRHQAPPARLQPPARSDPSYALSAISFAQC